LQLIRAQNRVKCEPDHFQMQAITHRQGTDVPLPTKLWLAFEKSYN
jgi:hypothetical protein